jgi:DNA mismatch repair protein MutS
VSEASTPLMRQYNAIKAQVPSALLLFRLGDFYELFYEDAVVAARELGITLTSRNKEKGENVPMCGVPFHSAETYIARLIGKGFRVAMCDQMEAAGPGKKLVRREVTRILTPGTATDSHLLRSHENNFLAAVAHSGSRNSPQAGIAHVDISTGEFRVTEVDASEAHLLLEGLNAREVLLPAEHPLFPSPAQPGGPVRTELEDWIFSPDYSDRLLREHFKLLTLDGCGLAGRTAAVCAAGAIIHYLRETQRAALDHLDAPSFYDRSDAMVIDAVTIRNLELLEPAIQGEGATLIRILDQTQTGMGGRLLRQRLIRPSIHLDDIESRLDAIQEVYKQPILRAELRKLISDVQDLERLLAKITIGTAGPRELLALAQSLSAFPKLKAAADPGRHTVGERLNAMLTRLDDIPELRHAIDAAVSDQPPVNLADGGTIRAGFNAELDDLRDLSNNGRERIAAIETRERQRTGIGSLKVRFNSVFGYYIEISRANLHLAPNDYERKQTLVNAERFTTPELKDYERKILEAEARILELEREIFDAIRQTAAGHAQRIRQSAAAVAELDLTLALAQVAAENRYTRPRFSPDGAMKVLAGRHPVIEKLMNDEAGRFIANDLYLDNDARRIGIITGPNMGGKSTYLRQAALIAILAQAGSFVPADAAELPILDRIFTRIGASDNLARGRSTFMVEMTEAAIILNTATSRSLVILDEIGRGTATYDGLSLAWAIVEYLHDRTRAKTLFATHYHELTELADLLPSIQNLQVAVKESGDKIIFLRKVEPGRADRSYGIEVARLAGLPPVVIERAREVLKIHERKERAATGELEPQIGPVQIRLFEPSQSDLINKIRALDLDSMRPIEALRLLADLQREVS